MREWVRIGWHLDGMGYDRYMGLTMGETWELHLALSDQIDRTDGDLPTRPKEWRK